MSKLVMFAPQQKILVQAYKSDGHPYRWWMATVESHSEAGVVTFNPAGHPVEGPGRIWESEYAIRSFYWFGKLYNLLEVYRADGALEEIYINIGSPPEIEDSRLRFTDWELDVVRYRGQPPVIVDEDEFEQAAQIYGYSPQFQEACYRAAHEALALANGWNPYGYTPGDETLHT
jgi:protein associated with RNAse G/E